MLQFPNYCPFYPCLLAVIITAQLGLALVVSTTTSKTTTSAGARLLYNGTTQIEQQTLVQSAWGPITGFILERDGGVNVSCYLGIPYSEKPIGELRFSRTKLPKPWKVPLRAVRQPPICYQREHTDYNPLEHGFSRNVIDQDENMLNYYRTYKSEDCLYLSVFTRDLARPNKTVLVWVHGGAFISGSQSTPESYDYSAIAATDPNLIVVAINYRLNVFGFISAGTQDMPGNFGIHDQILALEWIQKNIQSFGGNPQNVVLWGQSAGSSSVAYHIMSYHSGGRALFNRAILESGSALLPITFAKSSYRQRAFVSYLTKLGCFANELKQLSGNQYSNWIGKNLPSVLACLRGKSIEEIFSSYQNILGNFPIAFLPNSNDSSLFDKFDSFWNGTLSGVFPFQQEILIGTNEAEGAQYVKQGPLESYYNFDRISPNFTRENIAKTVRQMIPKEMKSQVDSLIDPILGILMEGVDKHNYTQNWLRFVQLVGDAVFVCPDYFFIQNYAKRNERHQSARSSTNNNNKVYYYRFKPLVSHPVDCPKWSPGACHTDELGFIFGNPTLKWESYPENEQRLSRSMMSSWIEFAHRGNPIGGSKSKDSTFQLWDQYKPDKRQHLLIELNGTRMVPGFPGDRCQELFQMLYETLDSIDDQAMNLVKL